MTRVLQNWIRSCALIGAVVVTHVSPFVGDARSEPTDDVEAILRDYLNARPDMVERLLREALVKNPQILRGAVSDLLKQRLGTQQQAAQQPSSPPDHTAAISSNADALLRSPRHVTLGNPDGDVTLVEFFDYNCGFCKRAVADLDALISTDGKLRVVLKELPVLGAGSLEAAQVGVALRMQDSSGKKYYDFHKRLMAGGRSDKAVALAAAKESGADMGRLERDLQSPEISASLDESSRLARMLGISGTPNYVIGNKIVAGARGAEALRAVIREVRG